MHHEVQGFADADAVARAAAAFVAERAPRAIADHAEFRFAVSGGRTPWAMFRTLTQLELPWRATRIFQVDERIAPDGDPRRNLTQLKQSLGLVPVTLEAMPVQWPDLNRAADDYAARLPAEFDLVHLGLGPDGHTASLVPNDPVLGVTDRDVSITGHTYQGCRRMTLTFPALRRAQQLLWLVTGADKREPLRRLLAGDASIPAGRVVADASLIMADAAALGT